MGINGYQSKTPDPLEFPKDSRPLRLSLPSVFPTSDASKKRCPLIIDKSRDSGRLSEMITINCRNPVCGRTNKIVLLKRGAKCGACHKKLPSLVLVNAGTILLTVVALAFVASLCSSSSMRTGTWETVRFVGCVALVVSGGILLAGVYGLSNNPQREGSA